MATQTGSIDLKATKASFDTSIETLDNEIALRVAAEEEIESKIDLKIDRAADSTDLISNINAIADRINLMASQITFNGNTTVGDELGMINGAISIDTVNETITVGSGDFYILITPTMMGFYKTNPSGGDTRVAFMQSDQLYVENNLSFGHFVFTERSNGHFTLKLID